MAVTVNTTPKIGGGFGNRKVAMIELSGTYATGGFAIDLDVNDAKFLFNGVMAVWDSTNKKLKLGTLSTVTDTTATTSFTELASGANLTTLGITSGIVIY